MDKETLKKAKEAIRNSILIPKEYKVGEYAYNLGYTQAERELSSQLSAYKEVLKELIDLCVTPIVKDEFKVFSLEEKQRVETLYKQSKKLILSNNQ